jgi:hypothetical protein
MHSSLKLALIATCILATGVLLHAQRGGGDADRAVANGGILVPGWTGKIDAQSERQGRVLNDARFAPEGTGFHVATGPATTFWNPANVASGTYSVKATFREPRFMDLNDHPHPYGIVIGGTDMGTPQMRFLYCVTYGDGQALIRGFGPAVFTLRQASAHPSVNRAAAPGQPVQQEIEWRVTPTGAECRVNGQVVNSYTRAELVQNGRLQSTDGIYGIRFSHNVEAIITGFAMTRG